MTDCDGCDGCMCHQHAVAYAVNTAWMNRAHCAEAEVDRLRLIIVGLATGMRAHSPEGAVELLEIMGAAKADLPGKGEGTDADG